MPPVALCFPHTWGSLCACLHRPESAKNMILFERGPKVIKTRKRNNHFFRQLSVFCKSPKKYLHERRLTNAFTLIPNGLFFGVMKNWRRARRLTLVPLPFCPTLHLPNALVHRATMPSPLLTSPALNLDTTLDARFSYRSLALWPRLSSEAHPRQATQSKYDYPELMAHVSGLTPPQILT